MGEPLYYGHRELDLHQETYNNNKNCTKLTVISVAMRIMYLVNCC